jgi:uncharacterized protein YcbK (DUF882 family)
MGDLSRHFSRHEFACKCGCGFNAVSPKLIDLLQTIRGYIGVPMTVTSGCRCEEHNAYVGGVRDSQHLYGRAADIYTPIGAQAFFEAVKKLYRMGAIPTLGHAQLYLKQNFVHLDVRVNKTKTVRAWKG